MLHTYYDSERVSEMIKWHYHHIIPRHLGGTDDKSNLLRCNTALHAFLHKLLWEEKGDEYDRIAWLALSGQIGKEEANILATKRANTGRKLSEENRKILAEANAKSNQERLENGTHNFLDGKLSKRVQRDRLENGTHNFLDSTRQRELALRQVASGNHVSIKKKTCPYCSTTTNIGNYSRWHGEKCKKKGS